MNEEMVQLVINQMDQVQAKHHALGLALDASGQLCVSGPVGFAIEHDCHVVSDSYLIDLHIPNDYPESPPSAFETDERIPESFHKYPQSLELCLGAPVEVRRQFARHRHVLQFIDDQVIYGYLFAYSYKRDYGKLPHGDLCHGAAGILQYYKEFFGTETLETINLLTVLAQDSCRPDARCPCRSGKILAECHGPRLDELRPHYLPKLFQAELNGIARTADVVVALDQQVRRAREVRDHNAQLHARIKKRKRRSR